MSGHLVNGGEVLAAIEASAIRARDIGYDAAIVELGFDPRELRLACARDAVHTSRLLPLRPHLGELHDLVAGATLIGIVAGVRLGRLYDGTNPDTGQAPE